MRGYGEPASLEFTRNESNIREINLEAPMGMGDHSVLTVQYLEVYTCSRKGPEAKRLVYLR